MRLGKIALMVFISGLHAVATAAAISPACAPKKTIAPCNPQAWDFGIDGLYYQNRASQYSAVPGFRANYGSGFRVEGGYHFGPGSGVHINWRHYNRGNDGSQGRVLRTRINLVDVEMDQNLFLGEDSVLRVQGGFEFGYTIDNGVGGALPPSQSNFKNRGAGPRTGMRLSYRLGRGFDVYADGNFALLYAKQMDRATNTNNYGLVLSTDESIGLTHTRTLAQGEFLVRAALTALQWDGSNGLGQLSWSGAMLGMKIVCDA